MSSGQNNDGRPVASSTTGTTTTTTTHGPYTTTTTTQTTNPAEPGTSVHDYGPHTTTITHPTTTTIVRQSFPQAPAPSATPQRMSVPRMHSGSIRIRRPSSVLHIAHEAQAQQASQTPPPADDTWQAGRRRSSSEPRPPSSVLFPDDIESRRRTAGTPLQPLYEDGARPASSADLLPVTGTAGTAPSRRSSIRRNGLHRQSTALNVRRNTRTSQNTMDANVVDVLDVIGRYLWMHSNYMVY